MNSTISHFERPERLTGYPLFFESCTNLQTRGPSSGAVENAMQKALRTYERNLKVAQKSQKKELGDLEDALELERIQNEASAQARTIVKDTLGRTLEG